MRERTIFIEALEYDSPERRSEYLDSACAKDAALRQRVEALLESHQQASGFLHKLGPQRLAEELAALAATEATEAMPAACELECHDLKFLAPSDKPGSLGRLGHYEIQEVIGHGGMGIVLRAFDEKLHRVVAIKIMAAQLATSATARKRFSREALMAAAVSHDHIVTIHSVEEADGLPYIVMAYVAGMSLEQRLQRGGPLELREILRIGTQTAAGLVAAHAQGVIHRDIKPANILLENGVERVKITDFGLARAADDASLTQSGTVAGTPHYMAPEQARGESLDARADLFSLGSVMYAMCTGRSPFRASGSMAVLKRVCEEQPTPIRECNPEVPEWLTRIIERLHAKDPADRFQSAAEVAELLSRHLAHVQHPSVVPLPAWAAAVSQAAPARRARPSARRRRMAFTAAVLGACLLGGLSLTEATGVTQVRATVIRIFTPGGTLIIETDDPGVKVTVEGDGGLVIAGAGAQEVRLRPGSYKVQATKNGKPVKREVVTINQGGTKVVNVSVEHAGLADAMSQPAAMVSPRPTRLSTTGQAAAGSFVLLGGENVPPRRFDTLAEAVLASSDGDTIEIRGNGPFAIGGVNIQHSLAIRAGEGYAPIIELSPTSVEKNLPLIQTSAWLRLEGLELRRIGSLNTPGSGYPKLIDAWHRGALHMTNCRLVFNTFGSANGCLSLSMASACTLRNCELITSAARAFDWYCPSASSLTIENCVSAPNGLINFNARESHTTNVLLRIHRNTVIGNFVALGLYPTLLPAPGSAAEPIIHLDLVANVTTFSPTGYLAVLRIDQVGLEPSLSAQEVDAVLPAIVVLRDEHNVYTDGNPLLSHTLYQNGRLKVLEASRGHDLAAWNQLWSKLDTASVAGKVRFIGGDLSIKANTALEQIKPEDFRLRADSAGYRADKEDKDLGADVDLVGPGAAYERWKKTPDYQEWLKVTGQQK
jgi:hypothetical protein